MIAAKKTDFVVVDVRPNPAEFAEGHIPGAIQITTQDIFKPESLKKLPKNKKVILVCVTGQIQNLPILGLRALGYDAWTMAFGYAAWTKGYRGGQRMQEAIQKLTGDLPVEERQGVVERLNAGRARVVIATGQLIGEGFDCPNLSTLFMATAVRFSGRVIQYLGRVLRPAPGKEKARVFDYIDVHVETLVKAANAQQRVYRRT